MAESLLAAAVARYIGALGQHASPATVAAYQQDLKRPVPVCRDSAKYRTQRCWIRRCCALFLGTERSRGLGARSLARRRAGIFPRFADDLVKQGILADNPVALLRTPKQPSHLPRPVDVDALAHFLDSPHDGSPLAVRDQAMSELFYPAVCAWQNLPRWNFTIWQTSRVRVIGKGSKPRQVPVGQRAQHTLAEWIACRATMAPEGETALFVGQRGARLGHRAIQKTSCPTLC